MAESVGSWRRLRGSEKVVSVIPTGVRRSVLIATAILAVGCGNAPHGVAGARSVLADPGSFDTAEQAAHAFARVSDDLFDAGTGCQRNRGRDAPDCAPMLRAAAFAQVMAANALRCTQAPIQHARVALAEHLDDPASDLPAIPSCT